MEGKNLGSLFIGTGIDMSGIERDQKKYLDAISELGKNISSKSEDMKKLFSNVAILDTAKIKESAKSLNTIDKAFAQIDSVVEVNKRAIKELQAEYERLSNTDTLGGNTEGLEQEKQAIQENIQLRKEIVAESERMADELLVTEQRMKGVSESVISANSKIVSLDKTYQDHVAELNKLQSEYSETKTAMDKALNSGNDKAYNDLKRKTQAIQQQINERRKLIPEIEKQIATAEKERNELQKQSPAVQDLTQKQGSLRKELMEMTMALAEMEKAGQRNTQEYAELQQKAGALSDAIGDARTQVRIFADDNAKLNGVISGLQGVTGAFGIAQGTMALFAGENEDLQKIMTKLQGVMSITMSLQQVQNMLNKDSAFRLVTINGLKKVWNKLTGEGNVALATNTTTLQANNVATNSGAVAQQGLATATKGTSVAMKGLRTALISTGIGALVAVIGVLVAKFMEWRNKAKETKEQQKDLLEVTSKGNEKYAETRVELDRTVDKLGTFNGTKQEEKRLINELNDKYGGVFGTYKTLEEWYDVLQKKGDDYCEMLAKQAILEAKTAKLKQDLQKKLDRKQEITEDDADGNMFTRWLMGETRQQARERIKNARLYEEGLEGRDNNGKVTDKILEDYQKGLKEINEETKKLYEEAKKKGLNPDGETQKKTTTTTNDVKQKQEEYKKAYKSYQERVTEYIKNANNSITDSEINAMAEGIVKDIAQIQANTEKKKEEVIKQYEELQKEREELAKKGDITNLAEVEKKAEETKNAQLAQIEQDGKDAITKVNEDYTNSLIDMYGNYYEKREKLTREWEEKIVALPLEYQEEAKKQMNDALSSMDFEEFKKNMNWEAVFGDLSKQSETQLRGSLANLQKYFDGIKDSSAPDVIKSLQEAIAKLRGEIDKRNPFKALHEALKQIKKDGNDKTAWKDFATALNGCNDIIQGIGSSATNLASIFSEDVANSVGEAFDVLNGATELGGGIGKLMSGDPTAIVSVVNGAVNTFKSIYSLFDDEDEKEQKRLERLNKRQKEIEYLLNKAEKANSGEIDFIHSWSNVAKIVSSVVKEVQEDINSILQNFADTGNWKQYTNSLEELEKDINKRSAEQLAEQISKIEYTANKVIGLQAYSFKEKMQYLAEAEIEILHAMRDASGDKRTELQNQLQEVYNEMANLASDTMESILGYDFKSLSSELGDAFFTAFQNGENYAKAWGDKVNDVVKSVVKNLLIKNLLEQPIADVIATYQEKWLNNGKLDYDAVMSSMGDLANDLNAVGKRLNEVWQNMDDSIKDMFSYDTQSGISRGIATASQDSVDENNARLTAIQAHTSIIMDGMKELMTTSNEILSHVIGIDNSNNQINNTLKTVNANVDTLKTAITEINFSGVKLKD